MDTFSPSRLTLARQRRELTKAALARMVGRSAQAITGYETGSYVPEDEVVDLLCTKLEYPRRFFFEVEVDGVPVEAVSFRSLRSMSAKLRDKQLAAGTLAAELVQPSLEARFRLPGIDIPDLSEHPPDVAAAVCREEWALGERPAPNIVHLLEKRGVAVYWVSEKSPKVDACSWWRDDGRPFVLFNRLKGKGDRQRFTAAHELGHLVLHRNGETTGKEAEAEADAFASSFLLPPAPMRRELPRRPILRSFLPLKKKWRVSVAALVVRAHQLDLLSRWHYEQAFKAISAAGWRKNEPIDIPLEESKIHATVLARLSDSGTSADDLALSLGLPSVELYELVPLARGLAPAPRPSPPLRMIRGGRD